ncbi:hypothetical protein ACFU99_17955 [Streptomyces sp. NPDC057654]|uniref:hypothetical protein n=1 Tax=Streptomyces sp. NPDC057654 TaxID=3346196 RepID=UPI00367F4DFC
MNRKLASTALAATATALLAGVALATPASAATAAPAAPADPARTAASSVHISEYYWDVTGIGWTMNAARAHADDKLKEKGCLSGGVLSTEHLPDWTWKVVVRGICPGTE